MLHHPQPAVPQRLMIYLYYESNNYIFRILAPDPRLPRTPTRTPPPAIIPCCAFTYASCYAIATTSGTTNARFWPPAYRLPPQLPQRQTREIRRNSAPGYFLLPLPARQISTHARPLIFNIRSSNNLPRAHVRQIAAVTPSQNRRFPNTSVLLLRPPVPIRVPCPRPRGHGKTHTNALWLFVP
jgi:hypothetical protein